jgi:hypothetical protein
MAAVKANRRIVAKTPTTTSNRRDNNQRADI